MTYWIDLFTWKPWQELKQAGANISGFREKRWPTVKKMKQGDQLICYLTGLSRFFAVLEVTGDAFKDDMPIWSEVTFPCRVRVRVLIELAPQFAVPVQELAAHLSYFQNMRTATSWTGHFRGSPTEEKPEDARVIIDALHQAKETPVERAFDQHKLQRAVPVYESEGELVTVPEEEQRDPQALAAADEMGSDTSHEEIQWHLLQLGATLGLSLWVASNDKNRQYNGHYFKDFPKMRASLPDQFDRPTARTIEMIDVLWLDGDAIVAAFEVEHTSSVYSGLLRMSDLLTMQPNVDVPLFVVAPDERRAKVEAEINRPTFRKALKKPLSTRCRFVAYSDLLDYIEQFGKVIKNMRAVDLLGDISEDLTVSD